MIQTPRVIPPIITPFEQNGNIYEKGIENLISFLSDKGILGIWVLGSYGAFPLMSIKDRMRMTEATIPIAKDFGIKTIIQIGHPSVATAVQLARHAQDAGADGLASVVPFYYSSAHYKDQNFYLYFKEIISNIDLPLFYYNNPKTTGFTPRIDFIKGLLEIGIAGIKDTTTDFISITEKIRLFNKIKPEGIYLGGSTSVLLPVRSMGAKGTVCGTAVAFPELAMSLENAIEKGNFNEAREIQETVLKVRELQGRYVGRSVSCYDILNIRGVDVGCCKAPWIGMNKQERDETYTDLKSLGVLD